ncbi:hypothetical protein IKQ21_09405 [bacterium]|nr:hypothetical protein [bacterium]
MSTNGELLALTLKNSAQAALQSSNSTGVKGYNITGANSSVGAQITGNVLSGLTTIFSLLISQSEADSMNDKSAKDANNLKKSEEKVKETTNSKLAEFQQQIQAAVDEINAKLEEIKDKEKEKEEIQTQLAAQTDIIEEASAYLNEGGSESKNQQGGKFKNRAEALTAIRDASDKIKSLSEQVNNLSQYVSGVQKSIEGQQLIIEGAETQMNATVEQATQEYNNLQQEAETQKATNDSNKAKGEQAITSGNSKITEGEATQNQILISKGNEEVNAGNSVVKTSTESNQSLSATNGLITNDLTQLTTEKTAVGSIVNTGKSAAEQALGAWGTIGEWSTSLATDLTAESKLLEEAVKNTQSKIEVSEPSEDNNKDKKQTSNLSDGYYQKLSMDSYNPYVSNEKIFDYDVQNLRKVVSI